MTIEARPDLAHIFRALADPNRLAIYELVRERGADHASVSRIAEEFDLALSTVSHHLKELRTAGLIRCERAGQTVYCSTDPDALAAIERFLER